MRDPFRAILTGSEKQFTVVAMLGFRSTSKEINSAHLIGQQSLPVRPDDSLTLGELILTSLPPPTSASAHFWIWTAEQMFKWRLATVMSTFLQKDLEK